MAISTLDPDLSIEACITQPDSNTDSRELKLAWVPDSPDGLLAVWIEDGSDAEVATVHISPDALEKALKLLRERE